MKKILILEDEPFVAALVRSSLNDPTGGIPVIPRMGAGKLKYIVVRYSLQPPSERPAVAETSLVFAPPQVPARAPSMLWKCSWHNRTARSTKSGHSRFAGTATPT